MSQLSMAFVSKSHNQLLLNLGKKVALAGFGQRSFKRIAFLSNSKQSDLQTRQTSGSNQGKNGSQISEQEFGTCLTSQEKSTSEASSQSASSKRWTKASKKYFKDSFLDKYPYSVQVGGKNRGFDSDEFGSLSNNNYEENGRDERDPNERMKEMLPEDLDETRDRRLNIPLTRDGRSGKNAYYYNRKMSIFGRQGKIKEALSVFEHWMMLRDRVMPNKRTFNVLVGMLGRVGYTEKAFELYHKMRNLGLDPEGQVYTGLFNACANSPWPAKSLKEAENILSSLQSKGIQLNLITLKAAAKAMAFCGNFPRAFTIMDEASRYMNLDAECFDHLLMACIADKQKGFSRALQVWQKMGEFNVQPQTNTFNLLIRSARDCGIGDPDEFAKVLGLQDGKSKLLSQVDFLGSGTIELLEGENISTEHSDLIHTAADSLLLSGNVRLLPDDEKISLNTAVNNNPKHECHNLFHDVPNFDRDMEEFLMQRDAQREKSGSADMYEWWEEQPKDVQHQLDKQLSRENLLNWIDRDVTQGISEGELEALSAGDNNYDTSHLETYCSDIVSDTVTTASVLKSERHIPVVSDERQNTCGTSLNEIEKNGGDLMVKNITTPALRLALLGGARKLILHMSDAEATLDMRTFSQLVPCLPSTEQAEDDLLQLMQELKVVPDVDFINDLILKRNLRHNSTSAKALLPVMSEFGLIPNMRTYAALALTCLKEHEAHKLLRDMEAANLEPNSEVMGHFIYISRTNFSYKLHMLQKMERLGLSPKPETIRAIEKSIAITKKNIIKAEEKKDKSSHYLSTEYQESFQRFLNFYKTWLQRNTLHKTQHPWSAFQRNDMKEEETKHDKIKTAAL